MNKRFIEQELENNPHIFDKPRCQEFIDRQTLTHVIGNVDCPEGVDFEAFQKVIGEVAETLNIFPFISMPDDECVKTETETKKVSDKMQQLIDGYIKDPNTRVSIYHNNETGKWMYSIFVENSNGFWLDSFDTEEQAKEYICKNNLNMAD